MSYCVFYFLLRHTPSLPYFLLHVALSSWSKLDDWVPLVSFARSYRVTYEAFIAET